MSPPIPNAYPTLFLWAVSETNYPAGSNPWNATPVVQAPAGDIFTPNTKPTAQSMNFVLNKMTGNASAPGNDVAILQACALVQLSNWTPATLVSALTGGANPVIAVDCVAYDPANDGLMMGCRAANGQAGVVFAVRGDVIDPFQAIQGTAGNINLFSTSVVSSVLKDPTDSVSYYVAGITTAGAAAVWRVNSSTLATLQIFSDTGHGAQDCKLAYLGGHLIVATALGTAATSYIQSAATPNVGTPTFGTAFTVTAAGFLVGTNGTQFVAIGNNPSVAATEVTSTNGSTFTLQPAGFSGQLPSTAGVLSLISANDNSGSAWFASFVNGSTSKANFLRSGDGVTWTTTSGQLATANWQFSSSLVPVAGTNVRLNPLAAIGNLLVMIVKDPVGNLRLLYSTDGTQTWSVAPFKNAPAGGTSSAGAIAAGLNRLIVSASPGPSSPAVNAWCSAGQGISGVPAT